MPHPLIPFICALAAAALQPPARAAAPPARPNILLISVDTLRADHLGCYGYSRGTSPNMDALAADGVLLENAFSAAPWTTPSHMSVFTSIYPSEHGLTRMPKEFSAGKTVSALWRTFREEGPRGLYRRYVTDKRRYPSSVRRGLRTLAEELRAGGYMTGGVAATKYLSKSLGFARGFVEYSARHFEPGDAQITRALEFMDRAGNRPFFLFLHLHDAHGDLGRASVNKDFNYTGPVFPLRRPRAGTFSRGLKGDRFDGNFETLIPILRSGGLSDRDMALMAALYDDGVLAADSVLGRLVSELRARGLYDGTVIVLFSDHGEALGSNKGREVGHNCNLFPATVRVPLIFKLPANRLAGTRVRGPASLLDIMPTLLALSGTVPSEAAAAQMRGSALQPCWEGAGSCRRGTVYSETNCTEYGRVLRGCVSPDGWYLVHNLADGSSSLYNVFSSPETDRMGDPALSGRAAQLEEAILGKYGLGR